MRAEDAAEFEATAQALSLAVSNTTGDTREMFTEQLFDHAISGGGIGAAPAIAAALRMETSDVNSSLANTLMGRFSKRMELLKQSAVAVGEDAPLDIDVLLLTVKGTEFKAALDAFRVPLGEKPVDLGSGGEIWIVKHAETRYGIATIGDDGNVESAIQVKDLFRHTRFNAAVLLGMAAGVLGDVELGDVVIASSVHAYDFVRATPVRAFNRAKTYSPPAKTWQRIGTLDQVDPEWAERVSREVLTSANFGGIDQAEPRKLDETWRPKVKIGGVLAGSILIEDNRLVRQKKNGEVHDRVLAAEMEGAGFAAACLSEDAQWMVVRGIADFGGRKRRKSWQYPATYAAAALIRDGIASGRLQFNVRG